ncbi:MAG: hypothetical protein K6U10_08270 [Acidobacteriia bacterium]|nr:hypothetical protein [Methyloceanibacter sp.]MCL6491800.1 hypothetical protein [Terriglobia bacterium]
MQTGEGRILTTHTGSLPRPASLRRLLVQRVRGESMDEATLEAEIRAAKQWVVRQQRAVGIDIGNDGEQGRESFFLSVRHRLSGFGGTWQRPPRGDVERYPAFREAFTAWLAHQEAVSNFSPPKAISEVRYCGLSELEEECRALHAVLEEFGQPFVEPFFTAPSPGIIFCAMRNEYYETDDAYLAALGAALKLEYETITKAGFLLQIDSPDLALERHVSYQDRPLGAFLEFVEKAVATINAAVAEIPPERIRLHVCWGNYEAPHDCDVPLKEILPILSQARVGALVLPFANPRHAHEIADLAAIPLAEGQRIVAGVIDTLTNFVEHPELVAERIERAARAVGGPERVIAGTDCGFDTSAGMGRVAPDVAWAKLAALSEGARLASKRLFGAG